MAQFKGSFRTVILSPNNLIYQNEIQSIFCKGDRGEFEILAYHYPLVGVLRRGNLIINWNEKVPIAGGIIRFFANECVILVQEIIDIGAKPTG